MYFRADEQKEKQSWLQLFEVGILPIQASCIGENKAAESEESERPSYIAFVSFWKEL